MVFLLPITILANLTPRYVSNDNILHVLLTTPNHVLIHTPVTLMHSCTQVVHLSFTVASFCYTERALLLLVRASYYALVQAHD